MMRYWSLILMLSACGPNENSAQNTTQESNMGARVVANLVDIPTCSPELEGSLVYVKESEGFKYCESEAWVDIDLVPKSPHFTKMLLCSTLTDEASSSQHLLEFAMWSSEIGERYLMFRVNGQTENSLILGPGTDWKGKFSGETWQVLIEDKTATFTKNTESHEVECTEVDQMTGKKA